jgi:4-aminobutyrate aminotransferase/(S)-3-amino-2-methylpropionate transaminase
MSQGLLLLKSGLQGNCIRVLVPLVISDAELDEALEVWEAAVEASLDPASERASEPTPHLGAVQPD